MKKPILNARFSKIRFKLFIAILLVLVLFFGIMTAVTSPALFYVLSGQTYKQHTKAAEQIKNCIPGTITYYFELYSIALNNNIDFEILNPDETIYYMSSKGSVQGTEHFPSSGNTNSYYSNTAKNNNYGYAVQRDGFEIRKMIAADASYFVYTDHLESGETLHIYSSVADVENIVSVSRSVFIALFILLFVFISLLLYILVVKFTKPLVEMNDITKDMAALNFERRCGNYGNDEIGQLGQSINTLSYTLDETLVDLKFKNEQLEKDIEHRHALDNARKAFINNVSHELKTPIAIISGYAEGLCEGISTDPIIIKEYCNIIKEESYKMNGLVVELLELSKIESRIQPFNPDYFNLSDIAVSLFNHLSLQIETNKITVRNNIANPTMCYGEADKIEIVLKNYITNAISHCSKEKIIEVDCKEEADRFVISVFNTGNHIADDDIPELWDSFYRADKSHKRSENRFGLGLSIVKGIMINHRCGYNVENVKNGVKFTFEIAKDSSYYEQKN
ncbi:MAG: HAMP domain-containing histidine kinase [Clostridia bacterium]|nr:HAMP domain-containing histidine kinase [Clostridia bacterium]